MPDALLSEIRVVNFRSARRLALRPGPICAFIGEPGAGKSNMLLALRALRGARTLAGSPRGPHPRARGLRAPVLGCRLCDRGAGAVSRPHAHRYLRRLIRRLAESGNQIFFTTHAPGLLSLAALDEVNLVTRDELGVTAVERLRPIHVDDAFRVMCEFDAERSELFLSRAAILVEGMTEKITLPFVFQALGHDPDGEQISIVECGGKANMPLFIEICRRARVPFVVIHDSDLRPERELLEDEVKLNALIRRLAGARRTVVLEPDFEGVAGFRGRGPKPERAWSHLAHASLDELPEPLVRAVELALDSAHPRQPSYS